MTPSPRKSTGRLARTHALCPARAAGLQEAQAASRIETLDTEEEQLRVRSTHQQLFTEILPCARCRSGPGAHDEQGSENPAHPGGYISHHTHTGGEARGSSHTHGPGRRGAAVHTARGRRGGSSPTHTAGRRRRAGGRVGGGALQTALGLQDPCSGSTARPSNKSVTPGHGAVLPPAQPPTTLPRDRRSWIQDSARSSCVLSCSKLSVARESPSVCQDLTTWEEP